MSNYKVGYFVGSLSTSSINRLLAKALVRLAPAELEMIEIPIGDLPLYNRDYDNDYPPVARTFKDAITAVDAVLFITPEYNRSIPGALKNAIDWASRPYGKNSFARKPSAVIGTSPGKIGTAIGQQHLRSILGFCNSPQMNAVEAYIQFEPGLISEDGEVTNDTTAEFLAELHDGVPRVHHTGLHGPAPEPVARTPRAGLMSRSCSVPRLRVLRGAGRGATECGSDEPVRFRRIVRREDTRLFIDSFEERCWIDSYRQSRLALRRGNPDGEAVLAAAPFSTRSAI